MLRMAPYLFLFSLKRLYLLLLDYTGDKFILVYLVHSFSSSAPPKCAQTELDGDTVKSILAEYKIHNADVTLRSDVTADDLIDVVEGNR